MVDRPHILFAENFDSYSHIIADNFLALGASLDILLPVQVAALQTLDGYDGILFSPGPGNPIAMPHLAHIIRLNLALPQPLPLLGICLGHQALGLFFGGKILTSPQPTHGKLSDVFQPISAPQSPTFPSILSQLPSIIQVVRYHSLTIDTLPSCLLVTGLAATGEVMAIQHRTLPFYGVQFHPEAHLTVMGTSIFKAWLQLFGIFAAQQVTTLPACKPKLTKSAIFSLR